MKEEKKGLHITQVKTIGRITLIVKAAERNLEGWK